MKINSHIHQFFITTSLAVLVTIIIQATLEIRLVNAMIATHVILGSIAFILGAIALITVKGSNIHRRSGIAFFQLMLVSAIYTLIVAVSPQHISFSMVQISIMTMYFLIGGLRSLSFKQRGHELKLDRLLAYFTALASIVAFITSYLNYGQLYPLISVFTLVALSFCIADLKLFSISGAAKKYWLILHLSKIVAGYTTAVTGFFVAQKILSGYYNWFSPTVACLVYIGYWIYKIRHPKPRLRADRSSNTPQTITASYSQNR